MDGDLVWVILLLAVIAACVYGIRRTADRYVCALLGAVVGLAIGGILLVLDVV